MKALILPALALLLLGCANAIDSDSARAALQARERDSLISISALPGGATVGQAVKQADAAGARAASLDSLAR